MCMHVAARKNNNETLFGNISVLIQFCSKCSLGGEIVLAVVELNKISNALSNLRGASVMRKYFSHYKYLLKWFVCR